MKNKKNQIHTFQVQGYNPVYVNHPKYSSLKNLDNMLDVDLCARFPIDTNAINYQNNISRYQHPPLNLPDLWHIKMQSK